MPSPTDWRWYLTIAAIREWMTLTGRGGEIEPANPDFAAAEAELGELSQTARLSEEGSRRERGASLIYRGKATVGGRRRRVECTVVVTPRPEGPLPQLVRVRLK